MTNTKTISGFNEYLPEMQIVENKIKNSIEKNYSLCGFTPLDTPAIERIETLKSKGDDNEIYGIFRLNGEETTSSAELGLRFDLTVPLARYIALNEGNLTFPFKRQQIGKVYRGERPQKGRYREFYQADIDIIGNGKLPLFADTEIITTIYNSLKEIDFGKFSININNKKALVGFLEYLEIKNITEIISLIDKKDKVKGLNDLFKNAGLDDTQIEKINDFINLENKSYSEIINFFEFVENDTLNEGVNELNEVYKNIIDLGVEKEYIKINPSISRGLNYYTGLVFETFIDGYEKLGSISSGGRYDNLCSQFTKNNYPGVGGSIGLSRLVGVLNDIGKLKTDKKTTSKVLVLNTGEKYLSNNLNLVNKLRVNNIESEIYIEDAKFAKQIKYADNKKIPYVIIYGESEAEKNIYNLKILSSGEQLELSEKDLIKKLKS